MTIMKRVAVMGMVLGNCFTGSGGGPNFFLFDSGPLTMVPQLQRFFIPLREKCF